MITIEGIFGTRMGRVIAGWLNKITEINRKYATPRIRMSRSVKIALLFLRLYLVLLIVLLGYKFWTLIK